MAKTWKILARHKWVAGCTITESICRSNARTRRYTATIRGWQNWKIYEGQIFDTTVAQIIGKVKGIRLRIDAGDETVFHVK